MIRAVRNQRTDDTRRKRLGVDIALQIVKGFVESCVFSSLVASGLSIELESVLDVHWREGKGKRYLRKYLQLSLASSHCELSVKWD